jgi:hypothetical protein
MRRVTVILAPPGSSAAIRDVMTDLSAAGLVRELYWLDHADLQWLEHGGDVTVSGSSPVLCPTDGAGRRRRLADVLAGAEPVAYITLCVLVTTLAGDEAIGTAGELAVSAYLDDHRRPAAIFTRLRVLVVRGGAALPAGAEPAFASWHNIVIAPEDAYGPALGHESLDTDDPVQVARHATPVLVALCGLWSAVEHRPLDTMQPLPGDTLRVVRSFYRRLDCGAVAAQLQLRLLDVTGRTPRPYDQLDPVMYVDERQVPQETHRMAEQLWAKHRSLLRGVRAHPEQGAGPKRVGWREVLRMFLSFLWAALKNTPNAWQQYYLDQRAAAVARLIEDLILGRESAYRVVVDGRTSDGRLVQSTAYALAAQHLADTLDQLVPDSPSITGADLSALWKDYASAALTLCDAQERSDRLPPVRIGVRRAIVPTTADVIRSPRSAFLVTPEALAAEVGVASVSPADIAGIDELSDRLSTMTVDQSLERDATSAAFALENWKANLARSYGNAFGRRLTAELEHALAEVRGLLEKIRAVAAAAKPKTASRWQRWLVLFVQCGIVLYVLALVADGTGAATDQRTVVTGRLSIGRALEIAGGVAVVLAVFLLIGFVLTQRELFRLINRSRAAVGAIDVDKLNLHTALRDVERLSQAITQYQSWSHVLGIFLDDPLGLTATRGEQMVRIHWGLPRTTAVGSARPDDRQVDEVSADLRAALFRIGWMSAPWEQLVTSAGQQLGPAAREFRRDPTLILAEPGAGSGSALDVWAGQLTEIGVSGAGAGALWADALRELGPGAMRDRLIHSVEYFEDGVAQQVSVDGFRAGVGDAAVADDGRFDTALFTDLAVATGKARVIPGAATDFADDELGWIAVTTQFSDGISFHDLDLIGGEPPAMPEPPVPETPMPGSPSPSTPHF